MGIGLIVIVRRFYLLLFIAEKIYVHFYWLISVILNIIMHLVFQKYQC